MCVTIMIKRRKVLFFKFDSLFGFTHCNVYVWQLDTQILHEFYCCVKSQPTNCWCTPLWFLSYHSHRSLKRVKKFLRTTKYTYSLTAIDYYLINIIYKMQKERKRLSQKMSSSKLVLFSCVFVAGWNLSKKIRMGGYNIIQYVRNTYATYWRRLFALG